MLLSAPSSMYYTAIEETQVRSTKSRQDYAVVGFLGLATIFCLLAVASVTQSPDEQVHLQATPLARTLTFPGVRTAFRPARKSVMTANVPRKAKAKDDEAWGTLMQDAPWLSGVVKSAGVDSPPVASNIPPVVQDTVIAPKEAEEKAEEEDHFRKGWVPAAPLILGFSVVAAVVPLVAQAVSQALETPASPQPTKELEENDSEGHAMMAIHTRANSSPEEEVPILFSPVAMGDQARIDALAKYREPFNVPGPDYKYPSIKQVLDAIPKHCFERPLWKSMMYAVFSAALTVAGPILAWKYLPPPAWEPLSIAAWAMFAFWEGTVATGCWVIAHECGHGAFSTNKFIQDTVGYIFHSILLVPYFSWQRSHAVHHSRTNHMTEGETHVPHPVTDSSGVRNLKMRSMLGETLFAVVESFKALVFGWPVYLMTGATGGPKRGPSNHFIPFNSALFPGEWKKKVWLSDIGILAVLSAVAAWGMTYGWLQVLVLYVFPLMWTNVWLVGYTWLQHTDVDIPHYGEDDWSFVKGAFCTVDRPYPQPFDFLHHKIGSTHVAHHVCSAIPHYHAAEATEALKKAFPELYMYDPTPILPAMLRVAGKCAAVETEGNRYHWTWSDNHQAAAAQADATKASVV